MIEVTLTNGQQKTFPCATTAADIAHSISERLLKEAVVAKVDGELVDLNAPISKDSKVEILTRTHPEVLEVIRHDTAHLLAEAAKELYGDTIQITIGPAIENGFYYDIARDEPFTFADLEKLEIRMREIVDRDEAIVREEWDRDEAIKFFKGIGEYYKAEIIEGIPAGDVVSLYRQGKFMDLCRGPHFPSTGKIGKAFKLTKLAGAYWRGDSKNPMLQRIYGTAWANEKDLKEHLFRIEEAEKRDHRKLGREMDLFHLQEEAMGSTFWHPKGWTLYRTLQNYIRGRLEKTGYVEVNTPLLLDKKLWEASGHWDKFRQNMFTISDGENTELALKPMNCPAHVQIFKQGSKSYRDLPLRMAEFGCCHRNEPSGALHGIMRVRNFVQDDAHIFCREDQIGAEVKKFYELLQAVYEDLGFSECKVKFSDRPEIRAGSDDMWDRAEEGLKTALESQNIPYVMNPGEGAFYGPKVEFVLRDALGRDWQCGTLQVDYVLPERLDASYMGEDGQKYRPVMLHRAVLGSLERFIGILIEHHGGKFPVWLAPIQVVVAPITSDANEYGALVAQKLREIGIRVEEDFRNEKISYKIREHSLKKVPYLFVVGKKEEEQQTVSIRKLGGETQEVLALSAALGKLENEGKMPSETIRRLSDK
jgi:threonyl-tRNA synthetase